MHLELQGVSASFDGGRTLAVDGVSFAASPGDVVALVGESGSGKTTTLKTINRLVEPHRGSVMLNGSDAALKDPVELRRSIGYVFQEIGLFPHLSVAGNVGIIPKLLGWDEPRTARRVAELLELVRLDPAQLGTRMPAQLSGGQQQRVGLARALAAGPSLMLLDEPFGALDPVTRDGLRHELLEIQEQLGLTVVLVTHDMTEALLMGDRILVMLDGRIVGSGTPAQLLGEHDDPYVARLMRSPAEQAERLAALADGGSQEAS